MARAHDLHLGVGVLPDPMGLRHVYAGTVNPSGRTWRRKCDVTGEFLAAIIDFVGIGHEVLIDDKLSGARLSIIVCEQPRRRRTKRERSPVGTPILLREVTEVTDATRKRKGGE